MYELKCGNDSKIKLKGICNSQSKNNMFEEYYNCVFVGEHQNECDIFIIRPFSHEMHLQRVQKSTLSPFDDTRCYEGNLESKPWD